MRTETNGLENLSGAELGSKVNSKQISPLEVIEYFADRIEKRNPSINAFVYTKFEYARKEALKLEKRLMKNENAGPFAGVPFGLKDFLPSKKGWTNSHGGVKSLICTDAFNSEFCTAMEKAGGIAIGKTNAPAFAFRGTCDNYLYGPTSTPFNTEYNSGGSSGGSAAAVADGMIPVAEGSDGGGSIRIPAAWCGCFGFKASVGTIPSVCRPDGWAATHPYCFNGGITRTVKDSAILLNYMAHHNPRDPISLKRTKIDFTSEMNRSIKGLKIAFTEDFGVFPVDEEVAKTVREAAWLFKEAGAKVEPVRFKIDKTAYELAQMWCKSISVDTAIELEIGRKNGFDLIKDHREELPKEFIYWNEQAAKSGILDYYEFNRVRTQLLDMQQDIFDKYDFIVSPTTSCLPVKNSDDKNTLGPKEINGIPTQRLIGFCQTFFENFTGNPAASVPAGLSKSGLPVGMQIIGKKFSDGDVFAAAGTFEKIRDWKGIYDIPYSRIIKKQ